MKLHLIQTRIAIIKNTQKKEKERKKKKNAGKNLNKGAGSHTYECKLTILL